MKVLHLYKTFYPDSYGGVEHFIRTLANATAEQGVKNTILTTSWQPNPEQLQCNHYSVIRAKTTLSAASCPVSLNLFPLFKQQAELADVLHLHFPWPFADLLACLSGIKKPIVLTYHSDIIKQRTLKKFYAPLMHRFLKKTHTIVPTSPSLMRSSLVLSHYQQKCQVIPLSIDQAAYLQPQPQLLEKWKQRVGEDFLLFIGQCRYYKGIGVLLQALQKKPVPTVLLGTTQADVKKILGIDSTMGNLHFLGSLPDADKVALLHLCKAIVLPSIARTEAFGIVLLEGLALGKPLISTELGTGTSYANQHNKTGLVVQPNDAEALAQAIDQLFSDSVLCQQFGENGRQYFQQNFQLNKVAEQYTQLYSHLAPMPILCA